VSPHIKDGYRHVERALALPAERARPPPRRRARGRPFAVACADGAGAEAAFGFEYLPADTLAVATTRPLDELVREVLAYLGQRRR
ncbi:MAG: hypothetical protein AVDCRST_MAG88-4031, partial [uncultured Thermomicrobiales bacterium]